MSPASVRLTAENTTPRAPDISWFLMQKWRIFPVNTTGTIGEVLAVYGSLCIKNKKNGDS
jgi:hypothetical protein